MPSKPALRQKAEKWFRSNVNLRLRTKKEIPSSLDSYMEGYRAAKREKTKVKRGLGGKWTCCSCGYNDCAESFCERCGLRIDWRSK
jgi:hypothetical protein